MVMTAFLGRWPNTTSLLLGDVGILPLVAAIMTVVFLAINSRQTARSLDNTRQTLAQSQAAELANRFQKGLELLESEHIATKIGGIAVLRDVATQAPGLYWPPIVEVLVALVESSTKSLHDAHSEAMELAFDDDEGREAPSYGSTEKDALKALEVLGLKDGALRKAIERSGSGMSIELRDVALIGIALRDLDLRNLRFENVIAQNLTLERSNLDGAMFDMHTIGLWINECSARRTRLRLGRTPWRDDDITIWHSDLTGARLDGSGTPLQLQESSLESATIDASRLFARYCWYFQVSPHIETAPKRVYQLQNDIRLVERDDPPVTVLSTGFKVMVEAPSDEIPF
jgi:hypothetical protein